MRGTVESFFSKYKTNWQIGKINSPMRIMVLKTFSLTKEANRIFVEWSIFVKMQFCKMSLCLIIQFTIWILDSHLIDKFFGKNDPTVQWTCLFIDNSWKLYNNESNRVIIVDFFDIDDTTNWRVWQIQLLYRIFLYSFSLSFRIEFIILWDNVWFEQEDYLQQ